MTDNFQDTDKSRTRGIRFELRLNEREREVIRSHADQRGLTESSFMRMAALGAPLPNRKTQIEAEAVAALNRVGSNLNQIARAANSSKSISGDNVRALAGLYKKVREIATRIEEKIQ